MALSQVASVPVPLFQSILSACGAVVMAGTSSGCEGTGSALEWPAAEGLSGPGCRKVLLDSNSKGHEPEIGMNIA